MHKQMSRYRRLITISSGAVMMAGIFAATASPASASTGPRLVSKPAKVVGVGTPNAAYALAPGQGSVRLVCRAGDTFQTVVVTADITGLNTSGVEFYVGDSTKFKAGEGKLSKAFPQKGAGDVQVAASYADNSTTQLVTITFKGQNSTTVKVGRC